MDSNDTFGESITLEFLREKVAQNSFCEFCDKSCIEFL